MKPIACFATLLCALTATSALAQTATSCTTCHSSEDWFDAAGIAIVEALHDDIHGEAGLSCHDCHGGNPDPALADDLELAMDENFGSNPYRGAPARIDIPAFCGRCHSDAEYMKRFDPEVRVDQEQEYRTSHHGRALLDGDTQVATCIDCHGVHGILSAANPASPVYPSRVAETCHRCHGDEERMAGYTTADGRPLPTDQFDHWQFSVHGAAMLTKGDLSAPTCNDCHGNHGAAPPGLDSITFVCGQCHGREADLFRASEKHALLVDHNDYLADAGTDGCAACHEAPEPAAELTTVTAFTDCTTCHGNHGVIRPTVAMLSPLPSTPCAFCHEGAGVFGGDGATEVPEPTKKQQHYEETLAGLLQQADAQGWEGEVLFDHLVDAALELPFHTAAALAEEGEATPLRPEFKRLFEKFRIGKVRYSLADGNGTDGAGRTAEVMRCGRCHAAEPLLADGPVGFTMAGRMVSQMQALTAATARAERILLGARRGGVETRDALENIESAVKAQIELEVLVHSFATGEGSAFEDKQQEGLESAHAALVAGQEALGELTFRRQGLVVALFLIVLVMVGLGLKIRELSRREDAGTT